MIEACQPVPELFLSDTSTWKEYSRPLNRSTARSQCEPLPSPPKRLQKRPIGWLEPLPSEEHGVLQLFLEAEQESQIAKSWRQRHR